MKGKLSLLTVAIMSISINSVASPIIGGDIGFYITNQNIDGWIETKGDGKIDLKNDLGYDDKGSYFVNLKIKHNLPIPYLPAFYIQYNHVKHSGNYNLGRAIKYAGTTIPAGPISSSIELNHWDFVLPFNISKTDKVDLKMGLNIRYINYDTRINSVTKKKDVYIPMFFLGVSVNVSENIKLLFEEKFMSYSGSNYSDLNFELRYNPSILPMLKPYIAVGYKYEVINMDDVSGINSAITLNQPYLGLGISF